MEFTDKITKLSDSVKSRLEHINTEEATKTSLILPFLQIMGHDVFDPSIVVPEFTADVGTKKGEKVDYAIFRDGKPIVLLEVKCAGVNLDATKAGQLFRYFVGSQSAKIGVLTDGCQYQFFTDLQKENVMDLTPFMVFDINNFNAEDIKNLKYFTSENFDIEQIKTIAEELQYIGRLGKIVAQEMENPSDDMVRLLAGRVYEGMKNASVIEAFRSRIKRALNDYINNTIKSRLASVINPDAPISYTIPGELPVSKETQPEDGKPQIVTTDEEREGYAIVKSIVREVVDPKRVIMRDTLSYCGILLDDSNRKTICRLHLNAASAKYLGIINVADDKKETRHLISSLDDIYNYVDVLKQTVKYYMDATEAQSRFVETGEGLEIIKAQSEDNNG